MCESHASFRLETTPNQPPKSHNEQTKGSLCRYSNLGQRVSFRWTNSNKLMDL